MSSSDVLLRNGNDERPEGSEGGGLVSDGLAEELVAVAAKLVRILGRRDAIRLLGSVLAAVELPGLDLDPEEHTRLAQAVVTPSKTPPPAARTPPRDVAHAAAGPNHDTACGPGGPCSVTARPDGRSPGHRAVQHRWRQHQPAMRPPASTVLRPDEGAPMTPVSTQPRSPPPAQSSSHTATHRLSDRPTAQPPRLITWTHTSASVRVGAHRVSLLCSR